MVYNTNQTLAIGPYRTAEYKDRFKVLREHSFLLGDAEPGDVFEIIDFSHSNGTSVTIRFVPPSDERMMRERKTMIGSNLSLLFTGKAGEDPYIEKISEDDPEYQYPDF